MLENDKKIGVGIGVMVLREGKILLAKRKGELGKGQYCWPGGKMEYMESFEACAKREVLEETGIEIENVRFLRLLNLKNFAPKHFIDIELLADWKSGEAQLLEPDKFETWNWYDLDHLPEPMFLPQYSSIEAYKTGKNYFDN